MKKVKRRELTNAAMAAGNERKYTHVIMDGALKQWVAIGWIDLGPADKADREKYPVVAD